MKRMLRPIWDVRVAALAAVIAIGAASVLSAQTAQKTPVASDDGDLKVTVAGQQVSIDPKTGKLRQSTAEEARGLAEALRNQFGRDPIREPVVTPHANGMVMAEVPDDYMEVAIIRLNRDGLLKVDCVKGLDAATQALETPAPAIDECDASAPAGAAAKPAAKPAVKAAAKSRRHASVVKPARKAIKRSAALSAGKE